MLASRCEPRFVGNVALASVRSRVLIVIGELVAGGQEQQLCYLLQGLTELGYHPGLVVWNYRDDDVNARKARALGVPMWGYQVSQSSSRKLFEFARLTRAIRPEVVHSYSFYTNIAAFVAARLVGVPAVGSLRSELPLAQSDTGPVLGRLNTMLPRALVANSHAGKKQVQAQWGRFAPPHLVVVSNGLDFSRFRTDPVPARIPHGILGIGSLVPVKRWDRALRLGQELQRRGIACRLEIAGEGPQRAELMSLAADLGIAETTRLLGHREDVPDLIARSRLLVHTSDSEGSPNAVMEAMASGRPVVATDAGDVKRLVENGRTGFVVERDDHEALVSRVCALLSDDRLARQFGEAAARRAREFSVGRLVEDTLSAYRAAGWRS